NGVLLPICDIVERPHVRADCDIDRWLPTSRANPGWIKPNVVGHASRCRNVQFHARHDRRWYKLFSAPAGTHEYAGIHEGRDEASRPGNTRCFELGACIRLSCADAFKWNVGWVRYPIEFGTEHY